MSTYCRCFSNREHCKRHTNAEAEFDFTRKVYEFEDGTDVDVICHVTRPCGLDVELSLLWIFGDGWEAKEMPLDEVLSMLVRKAGKHCLSFYNGTD